MLSDRERHLLTDMERQLQTDDPSLVRMFAGAAGRPRARRARLLELAMGVLILLAAFALLFGSAGAAVGIGLIAGTLTLVRYGPELPDAPCSGVAASIVSAHLPRSVCAGRRKRGLTGRGRRGGGGRYGSSRG